MRVSDLDKLMVVHKHGHFQLSSSAASGFFLAAHIFMTIHKANDCCCKSSLLWWARQSAGARVRSSLSPLLKWPFQRFAWTHTHSLAYSRLLGRTVVDRLTCSVGKPSSSLTKTSKSGIFWSYFNTSNLTLDKQYKSCWLSLLTVHTYYIPTKLFQLLSSYLSSNHPLKSFLGLLLIFNTQSRSLFQERVKLPNFLVLREQYLSIKIWGILLDI